jgi:hypothetical protein
MIHICTLTMLSHGESLVIPLAGFPFAISPCQFLPFLKSLLLTWNPSFCVVRSRPPWSQVARKLTFPSPFPPHSNFSTPWGFPKSIVHPTKTTSRSRLYIVRNSNTMANNYVTYRCVGVNRGKCLRDLICRLYSWFSRRRFRSYKTTPVLKPCKMYQLGNIYTYLWKKSNKFLY